MSSRSRHIRSLSIAALDNVAAGHQRHKPSSFDPDLLVRSHLSSPWTPEAPMALKTLLVHLDTEAQAKGLTQAAITVAKAFASHVAGLHVEPNPFISTGMSGEMMGELIQAQREANQAAGKRTVRLGDYVSIKDHGDIMRTFCVVTLTE
jgi:hypothetical protein